MRAKIENKIAIAVEGLDLSTIVHMEMYIKQGGNLWIKTPQIIDAHNMVVTIPYEEAMKLEPNRYTYLQFAYTDAEGNKGASDICKVLVDDLLKGDGYIGD